MTSEVREGIRASASSCNGVCILSNGGGSISCNAFLHVACSEVARMVACQLANGSSNPCAGCCSHDLPPRPPWPAAPPAASPSPRAVEMPATTIAIASAGGVVMLLVIVVPAMMVVRWRRRRTSRSRHVQLDDAFTFGQSQSFYSAPVRVAAPLTPSCSAAGVSTPTSSTC